MLDLLNADYTYVNERLARHYGIPNVRQPLPARDGATGRAPRPPRTGQHPDGDLHLNRTSPVLRGKWVLENILGTPPPSPPQDVPDIEENHPGAGGPVAARAARGAPPEPDVRELSPRDGPRFALENFDGLGQWREKEPGGAIDPTGQLANGTKIDGPVALRKAVLERPEMFVRTLTEKLMTYALGRGIELDDKPLVREVAREAAARDYRWSAIVLGIVRSAPFQMKRHDAKVATRPTE